MWGMVHLHETILFAKFTKKINLAKYKHPLYSRARSSLAEERSTMEHMSKKFMGLVKAQAMLLLPERASKQGNVIGSVHIYIIYSYVCTKKIVIERTRDLIYLKFVATDFSPKIISPSAGENSGDSA